MRRLTPRPVLIGLAAFAVATCGCGSSSSTPTTPTTPATATTETFTGTISANGAHTYPFVSSAGNVTLTLTSVTPDAAIALGISLGTWSGTSCTVGTGLFNDSALQGGSLVGAVSTIGSLCVRVYDGAGTVTQATTYIVTVVHP